MYYGKARIPQDSQHKKQKIMPLKNQPLKPFFVFSALGLQLGVAMYISSIIGEKLDAYANNEKPWWTLLLMIFAMVGTIFVVLKNLKKLN